MNYRSLLIVCLATLGLADADGSKRCFQQVPVSGRNEVSRGAKVQGRGRWTDRSQEEDEAALRGWG